MNALTKTKNTNLADSFFGAMDDLFYYPSMGRANVLNARVDSNEDGHIVKVEVPGLTKDDIDISYENNLLSISAEWKEEGENYLRKGKYKKSYTAYDIDSNKITAELKDGILIINVPKTEKAKAKKILIT